MIADGVHLGLPFDQYLDEDALGSTDLVTLYSQRWGWWWSSRHNPRRVVKENKSLIVGQALHAILLEGVAAYEERFIAAPDKGDYDDVIDTIDEMKKELTEAGFSLSGMKAKPDFCDAMRLNLPHVPVWTNIMADFSREAAGGRDIVSADDDRMLRLMHDIATNPERNDNAAIRELFSEVHTPLAEVSVFWWENGVRRRARLDRMFPAFDVDLKSLGNPMGKRLDWYIGETIARRYYDIQRQDHYDARTAIIEAIREGRVFGGTMEQRMWLEGYAEMSRPVGDYVWLFYQKPESSGRAPVLIPVMDPSWEWEIEGYDSATGAPRLGEEKQPSQIRLSGMTKKAAALDFYIKAVGRFGLEQPWARVEDLHYTDETAARSRGAPRIYLPDWIAATDPNHGASFSGEESDE